MLLNHLLNKKIALETAPITDWAATSWDNNEATPAAAATTGNDWAAGGGATGW